MRAEFSIFLSGSNLWRRKLRSFLTIGGMSVGIALIVFLVTLGLGLQRIIHSQITNIEALTVLDVSPGSSTLLELNQQTVDSFKQLSGVQDVSASISMSGQLMMKDATTDIAVYGINPQFVRLEGINLASGQNFSADNAAEIVATSIALNLIGLDETEALGKEVILRAMIPTKLEGQTELEPVPKDIPVKIAATIANQELVLVYAPLKFLEEQGVPASYADAKVRVAETPRARYTFARVKVADQSEMPVVKKQIENMGYQVESVADTVDQVDQIFLVFQIIVAILGTIAMFVAALGALNTLTVSLLERTREIGLLKALGASSADIYRLFMGEAILMGILGCLCGVGFGIGATASVNAVVRYFAQRFGGVPVDLFYTPVWFILLLFVIVLVISVVTGYYPARRAVKISPLTALHHE